MQHLRRPVRDLRSLPPHQRAEALRQLLRKRLPHIPRVVVRFPPSKPTAAHRANRRSRHGKGIHSLAFAGGLLAAAMLALAPMRVARAGTLDLNLNLAHLLDAAENASGTLASLWFDTPAVMPAACSAPDSTPQ